MNFVHKIIILVMVSSKESISPYFSKNQFCNRYNGKNMSKLKITLMKHIIVSYILVTHPNIMNISFVELPMAGILHGTD